MSKNTHIRIAAVVLFIGVLLGALGAHALKDLLAETGRTDNTVSSLVKAVQLNPRHSRAWYNLGLARNGMNQSEAAIAALLAHQRLAVV